MKAKILALLREREDYVSGQELCQRFGVSRTAVWKAMGQLKKEGYQIEAVQNRGYRLASNRQVYGRHELESRMDTAWAGKPVCFYEELASTNLQAKLDAENGAAQGALVVAQGSDDPRVKLALSEGVSALTGLGADQISICKGK